MTFWLFFWGEKWEISTTSCTLEPSLKDRIASCRSSWSKPPWIATTCVVALPWVPVGTKVFGWFFTRYWGQDTLIHDVKWWILVVKFCFKFLVCLSQGIPRLCSKAGCKSHCTSTAFSKRYSWTSSTSDLFSQNIKTWEEVGSAQEIDRLKNSGPGNQTSI